MNDKDQNDSTAFTTELRRLVQNAGRDPSFNSVGVTKSPEIAAVISKLHQPGEQKNLNPTADVNALHSVFPSAMAITKQTMSRVEDNENTLKLFPDIELAAQIIISSIVSPKDMLKTELNFRLDAPEWPQTLVARITEIVREEMLGTYEMEEQVYDILRDALFMAGSHPKVILPEAAIDQVINSDAVMATESISQTGLFVKGDVNTIAPTGILGNSDSGQTREVSAIESIFTPYQALGDYSDKITINEEKVNIDGEIFRKDKIIELVKKFTSVIDNPHVLKLPELIKKGQTERVKTAVGNGKTIQRPVMAMESSKGLREDSGKEDAKKLSASEMKAVLYKGRKSTYKPYIAIPGTGNLKRRSVGRPLVMNVPAESMVPVYTPGNYRRHMGYFVAINVDGNPITLGSGTVASEMSQGLTGTNSGASTGMGTSSLLTDRAAQNIMSDGNTPMVTDIATIYAEIVERDLVERLTNGIYKQEVEIGRCTEIYQVMLTRALQGRMTRLVYIPAEYVTYFAFKYHRNGVGRSYLDDLSNIIGMRAMVLFSSLWAKVRRSISTVKTTIKFDPKDPDPIKTIELVKHLVARSRQQYFPNGLRRVADFTDWIQTAGIEIGWEGHPKLPQTSLDFEAKSMDHVEPDDSLEETLRHMTYMHFGLSPETVDTGARTDFATTVQQQGVLFSKRIQMHGKAFGVDATDYTQKVVSNDEVIQNRIVEAFESHKTDIARMLSADEASALDGEDQAAKVKITKRLLGEIISRIRVSVPEPDTTSLVNMKTEIENYEALIDKALDFVASDKSLPSDIAGESSAQFIQNIREVWKAELMRRFLNDNNVVPEVFDLSSKTEDGKPSTLMNETVADHSKVIMALVVDMVSRMKTAKNATEADFQNMNAEPGDGGTDSSSSPSDDSSSNEDDSGGGDFGMGDDFGGGGDFTIDDTAGGEETPGETPEGGEEPPEETV